MNKVKMFFIAAALVLTTAGVFAGKAKFIAPPNVYAYNGTTSFELATGDATTNLSESGTTPATLNTSGGNSYGLYYYNTTALHFYHLYTVGF